MLVKFYSKAAADVIMVDRHAQQVLCLIGKNPSEGRFRAGELERAICVLEAAVSDSRRHAPSQALARDAASQRDVLGEHHFHEAHDAVDFGVHAFPLLAMMKAAQRAGSDVVWFSSAANAAAHR